MSGYTIPPGPQVCFSPTVIQRLKDSWVESLDLILTATYRITQHEDRNLRMCHLEVMRCLHFRLKCLLLYHTCPSSINHPEIHLLEREVERERGKGQRKRRWRERSFSSCGKDKSKIKSLYNAPLLLDPNPFISSKHMKSLNFRSLSNTFNIRYQVL